LKFVSTIGIFEENNKTHTFFSDEFLFFPPFVFGAARQGGDLRTETRGGEIGWGCVGDGEEQGSK